MDKSLLKKAAVQSVAMMVAVVASSFALQQYQMVAISASNIDNNVKNIESSVQQEGQDSASSDQEGTVINHMSTANSLEELRTQVSEDIFNELGDNYLVIKKPEGLDGKNKIQLDDLYVTKSIRLNLAGLSDINLKDDMFLRVRGREFFRGTPVYAETVTQEVDEVDNSVKEVITRDYGTDLCHKITITSQPDGNTGLYSLQILLELDSVYAYFIYEDDEYYFIDLRKPSDVYDKILVIDPGHGGKDAGALSRDQKDYEKNINLAIALELKKLLDRENIKVYYTRTDDDKVFLRPRVTLANAVDCDYFISIHCNSNKVSSPNGTEILYYNREPKGVSNLALANIFSEELGKLITLRNRGVVEMRNDDIFIMNNSEVPTVLIEVGYMSNIHDLAYLNNPDSRAIIAQGIYNGIMRAFNELPVQ